VEALGTQTGDRVDLVDGSSIDMAIDHFPPMVRESYLRNANVIVDFDLTLWPFVRPLVIQLIASLLAINTMRLVWNDIRGEGWSMRWRFRHDAAVLPRVVAPTPPVSGTVD
jgi:hypothetical protein